MIVIRLWNGLFGSFEMEAKFKTYMELVEELPIIAKHIVKNSSDPHTFKRYNFKLTFEGMMNESGEIKVGGIKLAEELL